MLVVNKADVTCYQCEDDLAEEMARPAQWLEPTDSLRPPCDEPAPIHLGQAVGAGHSGILGEVVLELEQKMGEVPLELEGKELGADRESRPGKAYHSEGVSPSQNRLPTRVTATQVDALGLKGAEHCVLYQAMATSAMGEGGKQGTIFLRIKGEYHQ